MAANNLGTAYIKIAPQMQGIQGEISKSLQGVINSITPKATAIGTVVSKGISVAMNTVTNSLDRAISRVDTLNAFPKIMKNLGFSTEESTAAIDKLSERIEGLPTGLDEIVGYTQRLASTMGNLNEGMYNATNLAIAFNDAALAGGKGQYEANRAFEQFSQVLSRGRPSMQDWKIMMEVMPGQLKQMAKYMGQNNDSLKEYAKQAGKTVEQLDGMDLYNWISADKNAFAKERLSDLTKALIDLDNEGGAGITSFKEQVGDATHTIGNALSLIPLRISKALAKVIQAFGASDVYEAIDKFTKSFDGIGDWIAKNVVPIIKNTVIPIVKNLFNVVKGFIEFIAKNKGAQQVIMGLVNAFVAFKTLSFVKNVLGNIVSGITNVVGAAKNAVTGIKTFATAMKAGFNLSDSFQLASMETKGLTSKIAGLGSTALTTANSISAIGTAGIAIGAIAATAFIVTQGIMALQIASIKATTAAREYARMCDNMKSAQHELNKAIEIGTGVLEDYKKALDAQDNAELAYLESKKTVSEYEKQYNELKKNSASSADDLREAELRLNGAIKDREEKQKALNEAIKDTQAADASYFGNQVVGINTLNHLTTKQEVLAGKYALVASQLDNLAKSTITYIDANGNLAQSTKEQSQEIANWTASRLTEMSDTWKKIYDLSISEGISLTEATRRIGEEAGTGLPGQFAMGVEAYTPLATDAAKNTVDAVKETVDEKVKEAEKSGNQFTQDLANGITDKTGVATNAAKDAVTSAKDAAANVKGWWNVGAQAMAGTEQGVVDNQGKLFSTMSSAIHKTIEAAKAAALIRSPSKATAEIGMYLSLGLAKGIEDYASEAVNAAEDLSERTIAAMDTDLGANGMATRLAPQSGLASGLNGSGGQVIQNNEFYVDSELDVKEVSKRLGWQVATAL